MSNVYRLPEREDPTASACEWLARLERGLSEQEDRELRAWLAGRPDRADALVEVAALWDRMGTLSRLADLFPKPKPAVSASRQVSWTPALAASLLLAATSMVLLAVLQLEPKSQQASQVVSFSYRQLFETAVGEHSTIHLPDGSGLTLNTNTRVQVEFNDGRRSLRLERGEVYVHVAHDAERPFLVWAADKVVRAVGTEFNVEITHDQSVEVIVTEGKVLIGLAREPSAVQNSAWLEEFAMPVAAGQQILLSHEQPEVEEIGAEEIDVKLSWRDGNIVFHGEPLAQVLGEIERYTRVTFIIRDEELKDIRVAGLFKAGDVDGLLQTLRQNFNISYERVGTEKIVLKGD